MASVKGTSAERSATFARSSTQQIAANVSEAAGNAQDVSKSVSDLSASTTETQASAAEVLNISQPAVSKSLRTLEAEIGFSLFERLKKVGAKHIVFFS